MNVLSEFLIIALSAAVLQNAPAGEEKGLWQRPAGSGRAGTR